MPEMTHPNLDWKLLQDSFGDRLLEERKRLEITQEKFAELAQIKRTDQHLYEQNVYLPKIDYIFRIQSIGVDTCYLISGHR